MDVGDSYDQINRPRDDKNMNRALSKVLERGQTGEDPVPPPVYPSPTGVVNKLADALNKHMDTMEKLPIAPGVTFGDWKRGQDQKIDQKVKPENDAKDKETQRLLDRAKGSKIGREMSKGPQNLDVARAEQKIKNIPQGPRQTYGMGKPLPSSTYERHNLIDGVGHSIATTRVWNKDVPDADTSKEMRKPGKYYPDLASGRDWTQYYLDHDTTPESRQHTALDGKQMSVSRHVNYVPNQDPQLQQADQGYGNASRDKALAEWQRNRDAQSKPPMQAGVRANKGTEFTKDVAKIGDYTLQLERERKAREAKGGGGGSPDEGGSGESGNDPTYDPAYLPDIGPKPYDEFQRQKWEVNRAVQEAQSKGAPSPGKGSGRDAKKGINNVKDATGGQNMKFVGPTEGSYGGEDMAASPSFQAGRPQGVQSTVMQQAPQQGNHKGSVFGTLAGVGLGIGTGNWAPLASHILGSGAGAAVGAATGGADQGQTSQPSSQNGDSAKASGSGSSDGVQPQAQGAAGMESYIPLLAHLLGQKVATIMPQQQGGGFGGAPMPQQQGQGGGWGDSYGQQPPSPIQYPQNNQPPNPFGA